MLLETALGLVGLVVLLHASPIPLPQFRPFSCGFCSCVWLAIAYFGLAALGGLAVTSAVFGVGLTTLAAALTSVFTPLFREIPGVVETRAPQLELPQLDTVEAALEEAPESRLQPLDELLPAELHG